MRLPRLTLLPRVPVLVPVLTLSSCCGAMGYEKNGVARCEECWEADPNVSVPAPMPCDECHEYDGHTNACGW